MTSRPAALALTLRLPLSLLVPTTGAEVAPHAAPVAQAGVPGHPIEDVTISNVRLLYRGGGTAEDAAREVPEREETYPEPSMFGTFPSYGLYIRHARGLTLRDIVLGTMTADARPPIVLRDVQDLTLDHIDATRGPGVPFAVFTGIADLTLRNTRGIADTRLAKGEKGAIAR